MTGVPSYSTTASENVNSNTGITWDEGMAPASVNNSARQNMADMRLQWNDASWFLYGNGSKTVAHTYASSTSTTIATDVTTYYHAGRRMKAVGTGTGTIYGYISASSYSAPNTTITYVWDSGSLSNETLTVYASIIPVTGNPSPNPLIGTFTPTDASGAALTFTSAVGLYRKFNGLVHISMKIVYPVTASGSSAVIGSLPFTALNAAFTSYPITILPSGGGLAPGIGSILINTTTMNLIKSTGAALLNSDMSSNTLFANGTYPI